MTANTYMLELFYGKNTSTTIYPEFKTKTQARAYARALSLDDRYHHVTLRLGDAWSTYTKGESAEYSYPKGI